MKKPNIEIPPGDKISLYFREGSSDKEYHIGIEPDNTKKGAPGLFVVNYAYGRRGSSLRTGTKTANPVCYADARKIYEKEVRGQLRDGYTQGESGIPYVGTTAEKRDTGFRCQLLNDAQEEDIERLIKDNRYCMEEKFNGKRLTLRRIGHEITGANKKGLVVGIPETFVFAARAVPAKFGDFRIDGESMGETFRVWQALEVGGKNIETSRYDVRHNAAADLFPNAERFQGTVVISTIKSARTESEKRRLFQEVRNRGGEGVCFKDMAAPHTPGKPSMGGPQLRFKFIKGLSCVVSRINKQRSVGMELYDEAGQAHDVGNVTIPENRAVPKVGDVIEVLYLYGHRGGSLVQPRLPTEGQFVRDDADASDCMLSQVQYKDEPAPDPVRASESKRGRKHASVRGVEQDAESSKVTRER